jgi:hypothetical protein
MNYSSRGNNGIGAQTSYRSQEIVTLMPNFLYVNYYGKLITIEKPKTAIVKSWNNDNSYNVSFLYDGEVHTRKVSVNFLEPRR